jgi:triosephosphate isomerase
MQTQRKIMIAGNWKENLNVSQASLFLHKLEGAIPVHRHIETVLFPNMLVLQPLSIQLDRRKFRLGAQNGYHQDSGAYTGEVSMAMLNDLVHYVLVGHSERRHIFNETDSTVSKKVEAAVRNGIMPVLCVGETLEERLAGHTKQIIHNQLVAGLLHVTAREAAAMVIAYEPVWAIGTGQFAKPDQAAEVVAYIRAQVRDLFGERTAQLIRVLYGGSVDEHNARSFLELEGCDGALVGGASLNQYKFASIIDAAFRVQQDRMVR